MNITNVKRPPRRFSTAYISTLGIQAYGDYNLYPQRCLDLILNSPTGALCAERYQTFIEGNGFFDESLAGAVINRAGDTMDDILRLIAQDMAYYHGFALHVNYNAACRVTELQHIPFQNCRLKEETADGKITHIALHPDWSGRMTRAGKRIPVDKNHIEELYMFNPIPQVVLSQIEASGGVERYRGQVLWFSLDGHNLYPKPIYDKVITCLSTDEGLDNVKYRNTRNNFLMAGMLMHRKGATTEELDRATESDDGDFARSLNVFQGDVNACSIIDITYGTEEDKPAFVPFETTNYDGKFSATEASVVERVYSAFGQEPWYLIRVGKTGWSGSIIQEAYEYYNSYVSRQRRAISRALERVCSRWAYNLNPSGDYSIQPLVYERILDNNGTDK